MCKFWFHCPHPKPVCTIPGQYPNRICSVAFPLRGTSARRSYGDVTNRLRFSYGADAFCVGFGHKYEKVAMEKYVSRIKFEGELNFTYFRILNIMTVAADTSTTLVCIKLNEQGYRTIFDKYYVSLCLFANQYLEDDEASADIVQDSFAKLWQIRDDFFYLHQVKAFLYTAVRNKALNELEHSKIVSEYALKMAEKRKDSFFHDAVVEEETYRVVTDAIDRLPDQMKAIMRLAMEGKKNPEIAARLNISTETVHTLKKIAYKKLRQHLKDYYYFLFFFV